MKTLYDNYSNDVRGAAQAVRLLPRRTLSRLDAGDIQAYYRCACRCREYAVEWWARIDAMSAHLGGPRAPRQPLRPLPIIEWPERKRERPSCVVIRGTPGYDARGRKETTVTKRSARRAARRAKK